MSRFEQIIMGDEIIVAAGLPIYILKKNDTNLYVSKLDKVVIMNEGSLKLDEGDIIYHLYEDVINILNFYFYLSDTKRIHPAILSYLKEAYILRKLINLSFDKAEDTIDNSGNFLVEVYQDELPITESYLVPCDIEKFKEEICGTLCKYLFMVEKLNEDLYKNPKELQQEEAYQRLITRKPTEN